MSGKRLASTPAWHVQSSTRRQEEWMSQKNASNSNDDHAARAAGLIRASKWLAIAGLVVGLSTGLVFGLVFSASVQAAVGYGVAAGLSLLVVAGGLGTLGRALQRRVW
jgi:hypothetical protein